MRNETECLDKLIALCHTLTSQGLTPTVGMVKAKATFTAPLPLIVSAIRQYKHHQPNANDDVTASAEKRHTASAEETLEDRIVRLEQQVAQLLQIIEKR